MRYRPIRLLTLLMLVLALSTPAAGPAEAAPIAIASRGAVEAGQWALHAFVGRPGVTYRITLSPDEDDVDLYLYYDGRQVARSANLGPAAERLTWTVPGRGSAVLWVYGAGRGTSYQISITGPEAPRRRQVGLQAGHWRRLEAPYPFNTHEGASGGGKTEDEVNLAIAREAAASLEGYGYAVDVLPTLIPTGYQADVVVAVHADAGPVDRRGFFADRPARSPLADQEAELVDLLNAGYARATGIPHVYRGTANTRYYYGYASVGARTPMALIETGFLTNETDQTILIERPDLSAAGIARAIRRFLDGLYWAYD